MSLVSEGVSQGSAETECKQDIAVCTSQTRVIPIDRRGAGWGGDRDMGGWVGGQVQWMAGWMDGGRMHG